MRKWLVIWILAVVSFAACSDDKEDPIDDTDPFLPIAQLEIPKQQLVGTDITVYGKGFDAECSILLQLNGGDTFSTEIVEVSGDSVVFRPLEELETRFLYYHPAKRWQAISDWRYKPVFGHIGRG